MIKSIQYKAAKIHYRVLGAGSPVLLLHGFGEDSRIWEGTIADLSKQFLLIVPDLPGSGPSQLMQGEISMESMAEAVLEILKNEIPDLSAAPVNRKPVLIGHSMGGYITLAFAEKYPQLLKAFGLFHSTAFADSEEKKQVRQKSIAFIRQHGAAKFIEQSTPNQKISRNCTPTGGVIHQLFALSARKLLRSNDEEARSQRGAEKFRRADSVYYW
jgi:pimeloyl-ACP methyl ester carboxylesterase